jgi:ESAT-6 family protein
VIGWERGRIPSNSEKGGNPMAGRYQATPEQMRQAAVHVARTNEQVQAQLAQLQNQLAPLAGAWKGQAATAFTALMGRWNTDARQLNQALRGIGETIQASGLSYEQAEQAQARGMSSITSALG